MTKEEYEDIFGTEEDTQDEEYDNEEVLHELNKLYNDTRF